MAFAVFDIETRIDKRLLNQVFFPRDNLNDDEALEHFRQDPRNRNSDFMPLTLHLPITIAVGEVDDNYVLRAVDNLPCGDYSEERLVRDFWQRLERLDGTLVSFNGRGFDLPVLELAALRYGIATSNYCDALRSATSERHLDLYAWLTNDGTVGLRGGMNLLLKMIGMDGKTDLDGSKVQAYFEAGRIDEIRQYCRADVIRTYALFLRVELMRGRIDEQAYRAAQAASAPFLAALGVSVTGAN
jgi:predicted PolB exonuclease-like 3'-5' exonuclease